MPLPDILISEDGTMVALVDGKGVATNRARPPDFVYDQWKRALLLGDPTKPEMSPSRDKPPDDKPPDDRPPGAKTNERRELTPQELETAKSRIKQAPAGRFACEPTAWCAASMGKGIVIAVEDGRYAGAACDAANLVIAPRARFDQCRSGALMINGATLRKAGALRSPSTARPTFGAGKSVPPWRAETIPGAGTATMIGEARVSIVHCRNRSGR
ncbi:hypothetical protein LZK73_10805 [Neorhizobium galegae]|nr:hypothetical protein LZK73_10805 [Neorhizobium galegae]